MNMKMFNGNNLPHELLLARQKTKLRTALESNMSTGITFFKNQISKTFGEFLGALLSKIPVSLMKVAVPLAKHFLASSGMEATPSGIDAEI